MPVARVHRISAAAPNDVSGIESAIASGRIDPHGIVAILGKTEGNGNVNDFTRGYATLALTLMLEKHLGPRAREVCLVMSGGTEGAMAPHWTVFERAQDSTHDGEGKAPALAIGRAHTLELKPEQMGRLAQVNQVAEGVKAAIADAGITDPAAVHFVQIKCPLLTAQRITDAEARGQTVATRDTLKSMGLSRGASALGVAVALGEIPCETLNDAAVGVDTSLWSGRASASAGIELMNHEIVVLGMSAQWSGPLSIDHAVMRDGIDIEPVRGAFHRLGFTAAGQLAPSERLRLVAVLAKAEASHDGLLRGHRPTMLDDSDISSTRHARAFIAGALGGLVGHAEIYVSGGAEHQGPDGGGPVALIVTRPT
jgi:cyanuric acid amidohydrolase